MGSCRSFSPGADWPPAPRAPVTYRCMEIQFTTQIFKEGRTFVAHTRELDVSSCGGTRQKALRNLEEAENRGTLEQILEEAGYLKRKNRLQGPKFIGTQ